MDEPTGSKKSTHKVYEKVPNYSRHDSSVDPYKRWLAREQRAREFFVAVEETKLLEEKVRECFKKEGVNHYVKCQKWTRAYFKRIAPPEFQMAPVEISDVQ